MKSINQRIAVGAIWSLVTRLTIKSLGLISTIILARLLVPADFGLIALTMTMVALFEIFTSFSFDVNIIQKDNVTDETLNSAWTCKVISGLTLAIVLFLGSGYISNYFDDDRLSVLVSVVAFLPFLSSLENIGFVLYRKNLDLKKEFRLEVTAKVISFAVTIACAYAMQNYWALVIGMFTNQLVRVSMSYVMHHYRPSFSLSEARDLFGFSKWLLLNNLLIFLNHKITDLIIGKQSNPTELGFYSVSYEISNLPTTELVFPLSRSIFPGYSLLKNDTAALRNSFLKFTKVIVFVAAPISFGMAVAAEELVAVFLGDKWSAIVPMISLLAFFGLMRCAIQNTGSVYLVLGKPKIPVLFSVGRLLILIPALVLLVPEGGGYGASLAVVGATAVMIPISFFVISRMLDINILQIASIFNFPIAASIIMYFTVDFIGNYLSGVVESTALLLAIKVAIGCLVYMLASIIYLRVVSTDNTLRFLIDNFRSNKK